MQLPIANQNGPSKRGTSRLMLYDRCGQAFAYRHVLRLTPVSEPSGRGLGTLLHMGLEQHYRAQADLPFTDPVETMRKAPARIARHYEAARRIYTTYRDYWFNEPFDVLGIESEWAMMVRGKLHTQKFDLIVRYRNPERLVVIDHKTTSGKVESHWLSWELSRQFLSAAAFGELVLAPHFGLPWGGVAINAIGTRDPIKFDRHPLRIKKENVQRALIGIHETNVRIDNDLATRDPWDFHRSWACEGTYGLCDFVPLCQEGKKALSGFVAAEDEATDIARAP